MASIIEMLDKSSLKALEALGRPGVNRMQTERRKLPKPPVIHDRKERVVQQKLPFIMQVIADAGYTTIWLGAGTEGSVGAHWTQQEQETIYLAIVDKAYTTRKTWYGTWGVVVAC